MHGSTGATIKDNSTQTETVFGLEDLPTVKEIVRKTIAKSRKLEEEQNQRLQLETTPGPVNGIYTCTICAKVKCVMVYTNAGVAQNWKKWIS